MERALRFFKVKNFEQFQHYKHRNPPWIKFYNLTLDDYEIARLPDVAKAHLFSIWLLASRHNNRLQYDAQWVAQRINATESVDLDALAASGLIIEIRGKGRKTKDNLASASLASCKQIAMPEREGETEVETETEQIGRASAPENIVSIKGKYVFEGKIIRLTQDQFNRWKLAYPFIPDFTACLHTADSYYAENPPEDGKWFFRVSRWLERANTEAKNGKRVYGVDYW